MDIPKARITGDAVYLDGVKMPGFIKSGGVTVRPGGCDGVNILVVEFIVSTVEVEDPTLP